MFTTRELAGLRAMSETAMPDTGRVLRSSGAPVLNLTSGHLEPPAPTEVYAGPLRIRPATAQDAQIVFGDALVSRTRFIAVLPAGAPVVMVDDVVHVDTSSDPHMPEQSYRVRAIDHHSYLVDRRIGLELIES